MRRLVGLLLILTLPTMSSVLGATRELGVRGGTEATSVDGRYAAGEVYYLRHLPWRKKLLDGLEVATRLDAGAGYLNASSASGGWLALGGNVVLDMTGRGLALECGFRPAWLVRHHFGTDDFGGPLQFASHVGLAFELGPLILSYRLQHMSNAHLFKKNPGLDLHLIGLGMRF